MTVPPAAVLAGIAAALAVALALQGTVRPRHRRMAGSAAADGDVSPRPVTATARPGKLPPARLAAGSDAQPRPRRSWLAWAAAPGLLAAWLAGPDNGLAAVAAALLLFAGRSAGDRRARRRLARTRAAQLPQLLDVAGLCLRAGAGVPEALVAAATTTPAYRELVGDAVRQLRLGAPPEQAFGCWAADTGLHDLGVLLAGHLRSGAPVAAALGELAAGHRRRRAARLAARAREAAVAATLPTAVCFLPAFVLVGVLPLGLGLLARLRGL
jgi:Flp pilus assembly protein TadB